eukprot:964265-Amphidinium_carterae.1
MHRVLTNKIGAVAATTPTSERGYLLQRHPIIARPHQTHSQRCGLESPKLITIPSITSRLTCLMLGLVCKSGGREEEGSCLAGCW